MTRGDTRRIGGAALLAALLLAAFPGPAFGQAGDPASAVQTVLDRSRRGPARAPSATAADLARLGSSSIPALLEALAATRDEPAREAVLLALEHLPVLDLRAHVKRRTSAAMPDELRCAVIEALGRCGNSSDLETMIRAASVASATGEEGPVPRALELAAGRLLDRDGTTWTRIGALLPECPAALRDALFAAAAARPGPEALLLFARVARDAPALAPLALAHLARGGVHAARPADDEVLRCIRSVLADPASSALPEAALAAGFLDDYASIPRLVELADDPRAGVRANAEWSLETLSGLDLRGGSDRWRAWHRAEDAWRREAWPAFEIDLASGEKDRIALALESIAGKRCHRHELARSVACLLHDDDPEIVTLACDTLRLLRSSAVRTDLEACRDHVDPAVGEAVERALAALDQEAADLGRPGRTPGRRRGHPGP